MVEVVLPEVDWLADVEVVVEVDAVLLEDEDEAALVDVD